MIMGEGGKNKKWEKEGRTLTKRDEVREKKNCKRKRGRNKKEPQ